MFTYGNLEAIMQAPRPWSQKLSQSFLYNPELEHQFHHSQQMRLLDSHRMWGKFATLVLTIFVISDTLQNPNPSIGLSVWIWGSRCAYFLFTLAMYLMHKSAWMKRNATGASIAYVTAGCCLFICNAQLLGIFDSPYGLGASLVLVCGSIAFTNAPLLPALVLIISSFTLWIAISLAMTGNVSGQIIVQIAASLLCASTAYYNEYRDRLCFLRSLKHENEKATTHEFLSNLLPRQVIESLTAQRFTFIAHDRAKADVLFCDVVKFTQLAARSSPEDVVAILNVLFSSFDAVTDKYGVYKIETIGDAYLACSGVVEQVEAHTKCLVESGLAMRRVTRLFRTPDHQPIVGKRLPRYHLFGETVSIAEEMERSAPPGQVTISESTYACMTEEQLQLFDFAPLDPIRVGGINTNSPGIGSGGQRWLKRWMVRSARSAELQRERASKRNKRNHYHNRNNTLNAEALEFLSERIKGLQNRTSSINNSVVSETGSTANARSSVASSELEHF